ncbi:MAG: NAD(P)-dependent oxidoreductase [Ferruginibacter sp.]
MKKVLVTGATGFIGSYVIEELLRQGFAVIATSANENKAAAFNWFSKVDYIEFDLKSFDDRKNYFDHFQNPDILIHLAWEGLPNYTQEFHIKENLPRHKAFLDNVLRNGLHDITVTGTCLEYGMQEGCLAEHAPADPSNAYGIAKNELRKYLEDLATTRQFNLKWIRLFYMYGKGQNPKSLISQLDKAVENKETVFNMSGGQQVRDFLPVEKVAEYIVKIASQQHITGVINCCSGTPVTVKEFVEHYLEEKNAHIKLNLGYYDYVSYEPMKFWGDTTKLKAALKD